MRNKMKLTKDELKNDNNYHVPGGSKVNDRVKPNVINISSANTIKHELAKCVGCLMLVNWGDIKFNEEIIRLINSFDDEVNKVFKFFPKQKSNFLTECVPNDNIKRRVDLVILKGDTKIEFETNHKIMKEDCITIKI